MRGRGGEFRFKMSNSNNWTKPAPPSAVNSSQPRKRKPIESEHFFHYAIPTGSSKNYENKTKSKQAKMATPSQSSSTCSSSSSRGLKKSTKYGSNTNQKDVSHLIPDVLIHKRLEQVISGPSSLHNIFCVQLLNTTKTDFQEILLNDVYDVDSGDFSLSVQSDNLLTRIDNSQTFQAGKQLIDANLGNLVFVEGEWGHLTKDADDIARRIATVVGNPLIDLDQATLLPLGYTTQMAKEQGRDTMEVILKICADVVKHDLLDPTADNDVICVQSIGNKQFSTNVAEAPPFTSTSTYVGGGGGSESPQFTTNGEMSHPSCCLYNDHYFVDVTYLDLDESKALDTITMLNDCIDIGNEIVDKDKRRHVRGTQISNPDLAVWFGKYNPFDPGERKHSGMVVEVQSERDKPCGMQEWMQALAGLKSLDVTYAILCENTKLTIHQLRRVDDKGLTKLVTSYREWKLKSQQYRPSDPLEKYRFDTDKLLDFMRTVICVMHHSVKSQLEGENA